MTTKECTELNDLVSGSRVVVWLWTFIAVHPFSFYDLHRETDSQARQPR